jgi:hypothetical protein
LLQNYVDTTARDVVGVRREARRLRKSKSLSALDSLIAAREAETDTKANGETVAPAENKISLSPQREVVKSAMNTIAEEEN